MSKTIIKKVRKENPFIMLDKTCVNTTELSWSAKGLHTYIMGLPDDWNIYLEEVSKHSRDTYETTIKTMDELILFGFAKRERKRNDKGQLGAYEYLVFEEPIYVDDDTVVGILNKSIYKKNKSVCGLNKSHYITNLKVEKFERTNDQPTLEIPKQENPAQENPKLINNNQLNNDLSKYVFDDDEQIQSEVKYRLEIYKDATSRRINQGVKKLIHNSMILSSQLFEELAYKSSDKNDPFNYLKTCIENCINDNELSLEDYKKDRVSNDKDFKNKNIENKIPPVKTRFHNINQTFNKYSPDELERILKESQKCKFESIDHNYKKTKFHNFDETFTNYNSEELNDIINKSQEAKFGKSLCCR